MNFTHTYDTREQSLFIKNFFIENKDELNINGIILKYEIGHSLRSLIHGEQKTLSRDVIQKLEPLFNKFRIKIPEKNPYYEFVICNELSKYYDKTILIESLKSKQKKEEIVRARQLCSIVRIKKNSETQSKSARHYNINHATITHAKKTIRNLIDTDKKFAQTIENIGKKINYDFKNI